MLELPCWVCCEMLSLTGIPHFLSDPHRFKGNEMADNEDTRITDYAAEYDKQFRVRSTPRSLIARGSKPILVSYQDGDGEWRHKIKMSRVKFDDKAKEVFLEEYRKWGRMGESAAAAGVSTSAVRAAIDKDEDFAEALMVAESEYKDKLISHHQDLVFNGQEKVHYDRNGNIMSRETIYPIRLIELELKKHDEGYRDKQELKVQHTGGVLIAPAEMPSIDDWEKRFGEAKDVTPKEPDTPLLGHDDEDPF